MTNEIVLTSSSTAGDLDVDPIFPHGVSGISGHALFRYRDRFDPRCVDPVVAIIQDLERGLPRRTQPRWVHMHAQPADFYITVSADERGPARAYPIRDGLAITTLVRSPERVTHRRRWRSRVWLGQRHAMGG